MKYVPNLIPERYRVEVTNPEEHHPVLVRHGFLYWLSLIVGILILGVSVLYISQPYAAIPLALAGLSIFPFSYRYLEKVLQFKFTPPLKAVFIAIVILVSFQLAYISATSDRAGEQHERVLKEKAQKVQRLEDEFINAHPYITRESYRKWRDGARDSVTDPNLKRHSFVVKERQLRHIRDSIWASEHR